jgi:glutathione S-transferase
MSDAGQAETYRLYHMPGACSRVALVALEELGAPYEDVAVNLMAGAQKSASYQALNPKGKVPVLVHGDLVLTETPVILNYLAAQYPDAQLTSSGPGVAASLTGLSDLIWCAGFLHPLVHRLFRPSFYAPEAPTSARDAAAAQLTALLPPIAARLAVAPWWYGARWTIIDVYLSWIVSVASQAGFSLGSFPTVEDHTARVRMRPSYQRALQRERDTVARESISLPPGFTL